MMDPTTLTPEETQLTKDFIAIVNEIRQNHKTGPMSFGTALKFMMARKFDVHRALALYQAHEITRYREELARFDVHSEPLKSELETGKFTVLPARDPSGAAIAMFTACKHAPGTDHKTTLQGVVYQLDVALEDIKTQRAGIVFVYNMSASRYSNFDYELSQKILGLLKGAYPARLKKVLIVTAPLWFKAPFRILRLFVREKLRDRVFMIGVSQLVHHIPLSALPIELGGSLRTDHQSWLNVCHKSLLNNKNELCDLASYNKFPLITHTNGAIEDSSQSGNGRLSEDDEESSSSATDLTKDHCSSGEGAPTNGNHDDKNNSPQTEAGTRRGANKPKPEKIIMPPLGDVNGSESNSLLVISQKSLYNGEFLHSDSDEGFTLEEFIPYMKEKGRKGLADEYNEIKSRFAEGTFETARLRANQGKNRYTDVLCYDHSRVKLAITDDDDSSADYINANYVDGYMQKKAFISTQGPLPKTSTDFWQMVWEQEVLVIVMTTRTVERCRTKCGQYWPLEEESSLEFGQFQIFNNGMEQFQDYVVSSLVLSDTKTGITRVVTHMQFTSWPDYGCPPSALAMLDFRDKVRDQQKKGVMSMVQWQGHPLGPPIVVHCSAGIGRTGTFITLDISILRLEATSKIDIKRTVEKIRGQRAYSIQMPDQYVFCYLALLEFALSRRLLQDVDLSGFDDSESEPED